MGRFILIFLLSAALIQGGECGILDVLFGLISGLFGGPPPTSSPPATTTTKTGTTTTTTGKTTTTTTPGTGATSAPRSCGNSFRTQSKIVGGAPSPVGSWPWQAALLTQFNSSINYLRCGGSLIAPRCVVTAAHCTDGRSTNDLFVRLGENDFNDGNQSSNQDFYLSRIVQHQLYNRNTLENDISLLILNTPAVYNSLVSPVCLPPPGDFAGTDATVSGWGSLREGGPVSPKLQDALVRVITNVQCQANYPQENIVPSMLCAGGATNDSCQGDSGGPLVEKINGAWTLIGVVSWGYGCARQGYPGVYTRVNSFLPWIALTAECPVTNQSG